MQKNPTLAENVNPPPHIPSLILLVLFVAVHYNFTIVREVLPIWILCGRAEMSKIQSAIFKKRDEENSLVGNFNHKRTFCSISQSHLSLLLGYLPNW